MPTHSPMPIALALSAFAIVTSATTVIAGTDTLVEDLKLTANDAQADDFFGNAVAISGTTAVITAIFDDDNGNEAGAAYVFNTTTGQQIVKLLPTDGAAFDRTGDAVAISGTIAIVGSPNDDDNGSASGSAYLFDTTTGQQLAKLLPTDGNSNDSFGSAVGISGNFAVVGAPNDDDTGDQSGSAYIFDVTTGMQLAKLVPADGQLSDNFGSAVAISGTTAIIGAPLDDDNGSSSGSAYLYNASTGSLITKITPADGAAGDFFGFSVAIDGNTAIVGAPFDDDINGTQIGSTYVFDATTGQELAQLTALDAAQQDEFGYSVAISGTTAIIGARLNDDNGAAYIFNTTTGQQTAKLVSSDGEAGDRFGEAVAISATTAIVGVRLDDDNGPSSGSAYIFTPNSGPPTCPGDIDGDGDVDSDDLGILLQNFGTGCN